MRPYQQLLQCALNIRRNDYAARYFNEFRSRMLAAEGENLLRNKSYLYEMGYLWKANTGAYAESIQYSDSLIRLIESGKGYFSMLPNKVYQAYRDRSILLTKAKRYPEAFEAFEHTMQVQDSILTAERRERLETIRRATRPGQAQVDRNAGLDPQPRSHEPLDRRHRAADVRHGDLPPAVAAA